MGLKKFLAQWPLIQQIQTGARGTGPEAMSARTRNLRPKTDGAEVARSICPYCAVGCGQMIHHQGGKLISIEGDPAARRFPADISVRRARIPSNCTPIPEG